MADNEVVQYIIVRKDLNMTHGKMAAQCCHASVGSVYPFLEDPFVKEWLSKAFTKIILRAKNKNDLEKLMDKLDIEQFIYKKIVDNCRTELEKESEEGTLTCIGIRPMPKSYLKEVLKGYQLYQ